MNDLDRLAIHTITTKSWDLRTACKKYEAAGVKGVGVWRQWLEGQSWDTSREMLEDSGLKAVSVVRGGFFVSADPVKRQASIDDTKSALDEAATLGASQVVLVCGADPDVKLPEAWQQISDGIGACMEHAADNGVKLAIEPLHPMYADCRSAINTVGQANDVIDQLGEDHVGIAVDVYHVWWDPQLKVEIQRAGKRICGFHVCDWRTPTLDFLNDRGLMGEGCIDIPTIRSWVESVGFNGFNEVEIFSDRLWALDGDDYLERIIKAYHEHC